MLILALEALLCSLVTVHKLSGAPWWATSFSFSVFDFHVGNAQTARGSTLARNGAEISCVSELSNRNLLNITVSAFIYKILILSSFSLELYWTSAAEWTHVFWVTHYESHMVQCPNCYWYAMYIQEFICIFF